MEAFSYHSYVSKSRSIYSEMKKAGDELVETETSYKRLDESNKPYLAKIAMGIKDDNPKISLTLAEKMAMVTEEYGDFLEGLSVARHAFLTSRHRIKMADVAFDLHRSSGAIARTEIERGG